MNRRGFLSMLAGAAAALAADPERALWTPGAKLVSIPRALTIPQARLYVALLGPDGKEITARGYKRAQVRNDLNRVDFTSFDESAHVTAVEVVDFHGRRVQPFFMGIPAGPYRLTSARDIQPGDAMQIHPAVHASDERAGIQGCIGLTIGCRLGKSPPSPTGPTPQSCTESLSAAPRFRRCN
jgi:hypothetical protein